MSRSSEINFVRQQGFRHVSAEACGYRFPALMFQPKVVGILVLAGIVLQSAQLFFCLSAVLFWSALIPALNVFDVFYNSFIAGPKHLPHLTPAPPPRRFAQGMAATFSLFIGLSLHFGWHLAAWILEGVLAIALSALVFGKFCLGSYVYHFLRHDTAFANRTLPWAGNRK